jgi:hypothetical protein
MEMLRTLLLIIALTHSIHGSRCPDWTEGDLGGTGSSELGISEGAISGVVKLTPNTCIQICMRKRREENGGINGATVPQGNWWQWSWGNKDCYCEINTSTIGKSGWWKTCSFPKIGCPDSIPGDMQGPGSSEELVGTGYTWDACVNVCTERRETDDTINGVTWCKECGDKCWCEKKGTQVSGNMEKFKTCWLPE